MTIETHKATKHIDDKSYISKYCIYNCNYFIVLNAIGKKGDIVKIISEIHYPIMLYIDKTGRDCISLNISSDPNELNLKVTCSNLMQS